MDQEITCCDCQNTFTFTDREAQFYAEKQFSTPRRCKECREIKKQQKGQGGGGGGGRPQRQERGDRELFDATCSDCGVKTQVPFQPKSDRPVYCRDCFKAQRPR